MNFWDKYNFLQDKPIEIGTSYNPLIYGAIYSCLTGKKLDYNDVFFTEMINHKVLGNDISILRHPDWKDPTSPDEIIGAIYHELIDAEFLEKYDWMWHDTLYSPKWYRVVQAGIYCSFRDSRNFFKDNNVRDLNPIAYRVAPHVKYYALKKAGKPSLHLAPLFYLWLVSVLIKRNYKTVKINQLDGVISSKVKQTGAISQKNISYLILSDLKSKYWIKLIDYRRNLSDYFEYHDHPIIQYLENN